MIKNIFLSCFLVVLVSCKSSQTPTQIVSNTEPTQAYKEQIEDLEQNIYFRASGNEPFWGLKISKNEIQFTSLNAGFESFNASHVSPDRAMDANVKRYRVVTDLGEMIVQISQRNCTDSMSGKDSPYVVSVEITRKTDKEATVFEGCGQYITDSSLHDIWVLDKMNGEKVTRTKFKGEFPRIEINTTTNKVHGFGGCNTINGAVFFEKGLLRFTNIVSTMMTCEPLNREDEFLTSLQSTTSYSVENMRLTLKNQSGIELIFKKVD